MARVVGVDLPKNKRMDIALTYVNGIGRTLAKKVLEQTGIDPALRAKDLTEEQASKLTTAIQRDYKVEGDLRREITLNVKRLMDIGCYRGLRHKKGLPVRGQRSHTNARTRKGPRRAVGGIRKKEAKK